MLDLQEKRSLRSIDSHGATDYDGVAVGALMKKSGISPKSRSACGLRAHLRSEKRMHCNKLRFPLVTVHLPSRQEALPASHPLNQGSPSVEIEGL
jgi:hypothetical protein